MGACGGCAGVIGGSEYLGATWGHRGHGNAHLEPDVPEGAKGRWLWVPAPAQASELGRARCTASGAAGSPAGPRHSAATDYPARSAVPFCQFIVP